MSRALDVVAPPSGGGAILDPAEAWEQLCVEFGLLDWLDCPTRRFEHVAWRQIEDVHSLRMSRDRPHPQWVGACVAAIEGAERMLAAEAIVRQGFDASPGFVWQIGVRRPPPYRHARAETQAELDDIGVVWHGESVSVRDNGSYDIDLWLLPDPPTPLPDPYLFKLPDVRAVPLGTRIVVHDALGTASTHNITIAPALRTQTVSGMACAILNRNYQSAVLVRDPRDGWTATSIG